MGRFPLLRLRTNSGSWKIIRFLATGNDISAAQSTRLRVAAGCWGITMCIGVRTRWARHRRRRCAWWSDASKSITTLSTGHVRFWGNSHRSGSVIWHDNTWLGVNSNNGAHTNLPYFLQFGAIGNDLSNWGLADGENGWDLNDPHGRYFSGVAASNTTISGSAARFIPGITMTPNQFQGMQVRNDHVGSECYLHSAYIIDNDATTITYYYYGAGDRGAPLVFNSGDEFSIRRVLAALDQSWTGQKRSD